ncbi:MAG: hypothetical protein JZD40_04295 [Sulfolobus sp.]|nr:hypothetical protein [Sulfolobus sp.]
MSERLQDLLLKYILEGKNEFKINCDQIESVRKLFLALGREVKIEKKRDECFIMVYSRVS